jgi:hypothetical protein
MKASAPALLLLVTLALLPHYVPAQDTERPGRTSTGTKPTRPPESSTGGDEKGCWRYSKALHWWGSQYGDLRDAPCWIDFSKKSECEAAQAAQKRNRTTGPCTGIMGCYETIVTPCESCTRPGEQANANKDRDQAGFQNRDRVKEDDLLGSTAARKEMVKFFKDQIDPTSWSNVLALTEPVSTSALLNAVAPLVARLLAYVGPFARVRAGIEFGKSYSSLLQTTYSSAFQKAFEQLVQNVPQEDRGRFYASAGAYLLSLSPAETQPVDAALAQNAFVYGALLLPERPEVKDYVAAAGLLTAAYLIGAERGDTGTDVRDVIQLILPKLTPEARSHVEQNLGSVNQLAETWGRRVDANGAGRATRPSPSAGGRALSAVLESGDYQCVDGQCGPKPGATTEQQENLILVACPITVTTVTSPLRVSTSGTIVKFESSSETSTPAYSCDLRGGLGKMSMSAHSSSQTSTGTAEVNGDTGTVEWVSTWRDSGWKQTAAGREDSQPPREDVNHVTARIKIISRTSFELSSSQAGQDYTATYRKIE